MWLNRMIKDRQEYLVFGELMLFVAAWVIGIAAAVSDYRDRTNANAANNIAAKSYPNDDFSSPNSSDQRGRFE